MTKKITPLIKEFSFKDIKGSIPKRKNSAHKGDHGKLLVIAGDEGFGGAGIMSAESGLKTGAGLVRLLTRKITYFSKPSQKSRNYGFWC